MAEAHFMTTVPNDKKFQNDNFEIGDEYTWTTVIGSKAQCTSHEHLKFLFAHLSGRNFFLKIYLQNFQFRWTTKSSTTTTTIDLRRNRYILNYSHFQHSCTTWLFFFQNLQQQTHFWQLCCGLFYFCRVTYCFCKRWLILMRLPAFSHFRHFFPSSALVTSSTRKRLFW